MSIEDQDRADRDRLQRLYGYGPEEAALAVGRLASEARFYANRLRISVEAVRERMSSLISDTERVARLRGEPPIVSVEAVVTTRTYRELVDEHPQPPIPVIRMSRDDPRVQMLKSSARNQRDEG